MCSTSALFKFIIPTCLIFGIAIASLIIYDFPQTQNKLDHYELTTCLITRAKEAWHDRVGAGLQLYVTYNTTEGIIKSRTDACFWATATFKTTCFTYYETGSLFNCIYNPKDVEEVYSYIDLSRDMLDKFSLAIVVVLVIPLLSFIISEEFIMSLYIIFTTICYCIVTPLLAMFDCNNYELHDDMYVGFELITRFISRYKVRSYEHFSLQQKLPTKSNNISIPTTFHYWFCKDDITFDDDDVECKDGGVDESNDSLILQKEKEELLWTACSNRINNKMEVLQSVLYWIFISLITFAIHFIGFVFGLEDKSDWIAWSFSVTIMFVICFVCFTYSILSLFLVKTCNIITTKRAIVIQQIQFPTIISSIPIGRKSIHYKDIKTIVCSGYATKNLLFKSPKSFGIRLNFSDVDTTEVESLRSYFNIH